MGPEGTAAVDRGRAVAWGIGSRMTEIGNHGGCNKDENRSGRVVKEEGAIELNVVGLSDASEVTVEPLPFDSERRLGGSRERLPGELSPKEGKVTNRKRGIASVSSTPADKRPQLQPFFCPHHHQTLPVPCPPPPHVAIFSLLRHRPFTYKLDIMLLSPERRLLSLTMSQIISSDSLTSPISDSSWDQPLFSPTSNIESFTLNYPHYSHPPSPPYSVGSVGSNSPQPPNRALGMRMSPDFTCEKEDQLCLPTHQVFELPLAPHTPPSPVSPTSPDYPRLVLSPGAPALKRPSSPVDASNTTSKKPRASGERVSAKDFRPPDVTGLSKREARLVKNRAAAFLSRQRKREEFENMEVWVSMRFCRYI